MYRQWNEDRFTEQCQHDKKQIKLAWTDICVLVNQVLHELSTIINSITTTPGQTGFPRSVSSPQNKAICKSVDIVFTLLVYNR